MSFAFTCSLGVPSRNVVLCDGGKLVNTDCSDECKIWLGEGDLHLCIDLETAEIAGVCGDLNTLRPVPRECGPVTFSDGNVRVSAGFRLFASTYLWYGRKGVFCDGGRGVVEFGDRCDAEIFFRVAGNLVVGLCGDKICCVILSGLIIRPDGQ